jgi:hypothetical protein
MRIRTAALVALVALAACANRQARPVDVVQPFDERLNCLQLRSEIAATRRIVASCAVDREQQQERNAMAVMAAPINPVYLMQLDTSDATDREVSAYLAHLAHLAALAETKGCADD